MNPKLTAEHLEREAIVYIRQSTLNQVRHHLEGQRLQYALQDRARQLGFRQVAVIDDDLGRSALGMADRRGFDQLVSAVCTGTVGAIFCLEASRLVFVQMESGATCALPAWMLRATGAAFLIGPPLMATGALRELRDLLHALPSGAECDKASLKPKEGCHEVSAKVSTRTTQPSPAGNRRAGAAGQQGPTTDASSDRTAAQRCQRSTSGGGRKP
jgi:hypothetical protein